MSGQFIAHTAFAWFSCGFICGPLIKGPGQMWMIRLPFVLTVGTFLGVQAASWERPATQFHELVTQPAPHGSYLRRVLKEHFPVWWAQVSSDLYSNGYSLPEMNEYDKATKIQKSHTQFDGRVQ